MKVVISIPDLGGLVSEQQATEMLMRPVAGVPLLMRTVLTAVRTGASDVLLLVPSGMSDRFLQKLVQQISQRGVRIELIRISEFDPQAWSRWIILSQPLKEECFAPKAWSSWSIRRQHLKDEFLWLPWNWITTKNFLSQLPLVDINSVDW